MTENLLATTPADTPIATIRGQPLAQMPSDLYIPPQALEVLLEAFTGPLDLLLYLIKKQNFDILDIPVAEITRQYMQYIELMQVLEIELAAEYLVMAAILTEIKSRLLLPKPFEAQTNDEADPRAELIRRLQEYERTKQAAQTLEQLPRLGRDVFLAMAEAVLPSVSAENPRQLPPLALEELVEAFQAVLSRAALRTHHAIAEEPLSIKDRMAQILHKITTQSQLKFTELFKLDEGRMGVVVTFMALLELWRQSLVKLSQADPFGEIEVRGI
ncbi:ScpA family protein [Rickettsiella endosymbiont of Aleochara curtula]|uniref:segregation and condensation protein A n=1 Tax=Rickettsiella endosymbiont of Aleochara curtula TaxID=3077936 RepID=UPI00313F2479